MELSPGIAKKLQKLAAAAAEKDLWQVNVTARALLGAQAALDDGINFIGALHETSHLANVMQPYWQALRDGDPAFLPRCFARLKGGDFDYWSLGAVLGTTAGSARAALAALGYTMVAVVQYPRFGQAPAQKATFIVQRRDMALSPVVELGCDSATGEVTQAIRWRAVILDHADETPAGLAGKGSGTYFMEARLPRFSWRVQSQPFEINSAELIDAAGSQFAGA